MVGLISMDLSEYTSKVENYLNGKVRHSYSEIFKILHNPDLEYKAKTELIAKHLVKCLPSTDSEKLIAATLFELNDGKHMQFNDYCQNSNLKYMLLTIGNGLATKFALDNPRGYRFEYINDKCSVQYNADHSFTKHQDEDSGSEEEEVEYVPRHKNYVDFGQGFHHPRGRGRGFGQNYYHPRGRGRGTGFHGRGGYHRNGKTGAGSNAVESSSSIANSSIGKSKTVNGEVSFESSNSFALLKEHSDKKKNDEVEKNKESLIKDADKVTQVMINNEKKVNEMKNKKWSEEPNDDDEDDELVEENKSSKKDKDAKNDKVSEKTSN